MIAMIRATLPRYTSGKQSSSTSNRRDHVRKFRYPASNDNAAIAVSERMPEHASATS
jgi:hypothetical protein